MPTFGFNVSADVSIFFISQEQLSRWCTIDLRNSIRQMLPAVFGPELAKKLSLKGQNKKTSVGDTFVFEVLSGKFWCLILVFGLWPWCLTNF